LDCISIIYKYIQYFNVERLPATINALYRYEAQGQAFLALFSSLVHDHEPFKKRGQATDATVTIRMAEIDGPGIARDKLQVQEPDLVDRQGPWLCLSSIRFIYLYIII
jgi:hypothetical protein